MSSRPNGLLLGAGASCELGMPLVGELTRDVRAAYQRADLRAVNRLRAAQGQEILPQAIVEELYAMLGRDDVHYEALLGYFETQQYRAENRQHLQAYRRVREATIAMVSRILLGRHVKAGDPAGDCERRI